MKKYSYFFLALTMLMGSSVFVSCGDDDDDVPEIKQETPAETPETPAPPTPPADPNIGNLSIAGFSADIKYCNMMAMFMDYDITDNDGNVIMPQFDKNGNQLAWCEIRYSSWDMTKQWEVPEGHTPSFVQLSFFGYADSKGEYISGTYECGGGHGVINENQETWESDVEFNFEPTTIKVERGENNIYTVTVPMAGEYRLKDQWNNPQQYRSTFKYVGLMVNMANVGDEE